MECVLLCLTTMSQHDVSRACPVASHSGLWLVLIFKGSCIPLLRWVWRLIPLWGFCEQGCFWQTKGIPSIAYVSGSKMNEPEGDICSVLVDTANFWEFQCFPFLLTLCVLLILVSGDNIIVNQNKNIVNLEFCILCMTSWSFTQICFVSSWNA